MDKIVGFLHFVSKSPKERIIQILTRNNTIVVLTCDILLNILKNNIPVKPELLKKLKKHRRTIYKLVDKRIPIERKKKLLAKNWPIVEVLEPLLPLIAKSFKYEPLYKNVSHKRRRQTSSR